jgi:phosphoglycolate phosphatase-like HAD superfamily hydrolase
MDRATAQVDNDFIPTTVIDPARFDCVIFDMDGVLTDTASLHATAWKQLFDEYLQQRAAQTGEKSEPFDEVEDSSVKLVTRRTEVRVGRLINPCIRARA